ncbi:amino acid adenylation domain-containing protein [Micromonospora sp. H61]|uniref:amino acid adenylation domain-containing protein n=1 Tax=Micromonospora sp. H61 TaxID=2824888 RepID=UPI0027DC4A1C|nr:amino acid adenylation domain-containing protein [Micromonospora sp. H61]
MTPSFTQPGFARIVGVDTPESALCHALAVRLTEDVDAEALRHRFDTAVRRWWPGPADRTPTLWSEAVPSARGTPLARHRLRTEMHRPVSRTGPVLRAVVLTYADASRDLVLTGHRGTLDPPSLRVLAEVLTGRRSPDPLTAQPLPAEVTATPRRTPSGGRRVEWGMGDAQAGDRTDVFRLPLGAAAGDPLTSLSAAAVVVLSRYEGREVVRTGRVRSPASRASEALGAFDEVAVLTVDLSRVRSNEDLLDSLSTSPDVSPQDTAERRPDVGVLEVAAAAGEADIPAELPCQSALFPLTLVLAPGADGTTDVEVRHQVRHVGAAAARAYAECVALVHRQLTERPDGLVRDLDLLDAEAGARQLALGLAPESAPPRPRRIDALFDEWAERHPGAVALRRGDAALTYGQLRERADLVAAGLRLRGVRPGDHVGICLDRSLDLVVTMLAVLKADAVYVPMDPSHPPQRRAHIVRDAGLRVVVSDLPDFPGGDGSVLGVAELVRAGGAGGPAVPRRGPGDAAYVIYTSGSTGRPKGVEVPHRNVTGLVAATRDDFALHPDDTWTLFHSSAFDFSVWEIWGALLTGATLVVVPYDVSRSPTEFHELLVRERVTVLNQTPSAFGQLMEADRRSAAPLAVRLVVFGGEPLDTRVLLGWFDRYPEDRCRLVNMFGITETTVHATAQTVTRREALAGTRSVGRALPGWRLYVLDPQGRPVPTGVTGEIWVGGAGVASGYLGLPELTAERFQPDPFLEGRRYRSGDLGRFRPDGSLEHLGRLDDQVKVRGFRVELDEIRNVLLDDRAVRAAAVLVSGDALKDAATVRIDAYVVLDGQDTEAVRRRASRILPEYMVPTTLTALDALPLTGNGKLDPDRLPAPATPASPPKATAGKPAGLSGDLAEVWESVLGVSVGLDDNFFALGGNSLYAVRIGSAMRERGLPALSMRQLYLTPTVRALAADLDQQRS